jgi:hypothetical protein
MPHEKTIIEINKMISRTVSKESPLRGSGVLRNYFIKNRAIWELLLFVNRYLIRNKRKTITDSMSASIRYTKLIVPLR